jgi:hypothetical protein
VAKTDLTFRIFGEDKSASKTLRKVGDEADRTNKGLGKLSKVGMAGLAAGAAAAAAGVVVLANGLVDSVKAAAEDQKAQKLLATSLRNSAKATDEQIAATEEWIDAQQRATGIADSDLRPALASLARVTGDAEEAQKLLTTAMDVSAATGKPLETVSLALAKAYTGQTGALGRLGLNMKDSNGKAVSFKVAMERLNTQFSGAAAAAADTYEGKMARLGVAFDEFKESIGAKILPVVERFSTWFLEEGVPALEAFWQKIEQDVIPVIVAYLKPAVEGVQEALAEMAKVVRDNQQMFDDLMTIAKPLAALFAGNFKITLKGLVVVFGAATQVAKAYWTVLRSLRSAADGVAESFLLMWLRFRSAFNNIAAAWNRMSFDFPSASGDWNGILPGGEFTVGGWTIDTPNIPMLASGGIVTRPTLAMIGEAGPEAVIPLNRAGAAVGAPIINVHIRQPLGTPDQIARAVLDSVQTASSRGTLRRLGDGGARISGLNYRGARDALGY